MRIWKKVVISIGSLVGLLVVIGGGLFAYASSDKQDTFFLRDAELSDPNYLRDLAAAGEAVRDAPVERLRVYAHRLTRGRGTIFAYRFHSKGSLGIIDDESYRKLTIWIASLPASSKGEINLGDESKAIVIFSRGGSAWPKSECSGYVTSGRLTIERAGVKYRLAVLGILQQTGGRKSDQCDGLNIDLNFKAREITYGRLTPWLGSTGANPYQETYRPFWR